MPRSAALVRAAASPPGATRISSSRTGGARLDRRRGRSCAGRSALDDAARDELGGRGSASPSSASASGVSQIARRLTVRPPSRRSAEAPTRTTVSRSSVARIAQPDDEQPAGRQLAGGRERGREALAGQLAEGDERLQLAAGAPVELAERAVEGGLGGDGTTRTSRGTSHGWSVTTRSCTGVGPPEGATAWAAWATVGGLGLWPPV